MSHVEPGSAAKFDFREDRHTAVLICAHVAAGSPVVFVAHDPEGDWQFLCGGDHGEASGEAPLVVSLVEVVAGDASLNELAPLCINHHAERDSSLGTWRIVDDGEEFIERSVRDRGWAVQLIPAADTEREPAFAYTVGLFKTFGFSEIITFGMDLHAMAAILNVCGDRVKAGDRLAIGPAISGVLVGFDVRLREVKAPTSYASHVGYALWFHKGPNFPLVQLVWPDKQGRFPGDAGAAEFMARAQPLLP